MGRPSDRESLKTMKHHIDVIYLNAPPSLFDEIEALGALWDSDLDVYYIPVNEPNLYTDAGQVFMPLMINVVVPKFYLVTAVLKCWHCQADTLVFGVCLPNTSVVYAEPATEFEEYPELVFNRDSYSKEVLDNGWVFSLSKLSASILTDITYANHDALEFLIYEADYCLQLNKKSSKMEYGNCCMFCAAKLGSDYDAMLFEYSNSYKQIDIPLLARGNTDTVALLGSGYSALERIQAAAIYKYGIL